MCQSSKEKKSAQTAAQTAAETAKTEGQRAEEKIIGAGQPTPTESGLQTTFTTKATQPAEQTMQEAGPISQAVSQRILERMQNPGMDYDVNNINTAIGTPVWAGLKARGITAQPGDTSGGGLGTQQYMKEMVPYLAQGRQAQINTDIATGQNYGQNAQATQLNYSNLATAIAQALGERNLQATETGVPYRVSGMNTGEAINQQSVAQQNAQKQSDNAAIAKLIATAVIGAATGGIGAGAMGLSTGAGMATGALTGLGSNFNSGGSDSGINMNSLAIANAIKNQTPSTASLQLGQRQFGLTNPYGTGGNAFGS